MHVFRRFFSSCRVQSLLPMEMRSIQLFSLLLTEKMKFIVFTFRMLSSPFFLRSFRVFVMGVPAAGTTVVWFHDSKFETNQAAQEDHVVLLQL